ncbi:MAG TPA: hypothetical protein VEI03_09690 [Stellaceae bacterium]|nr:hypothetical protein [Stellaceae bacterium]
MTIDQEKPLNDSMPPIAIFLLSSHGHAASLSAAAGPASAVAQASGFLLVLLAASLIVTAMERLRRR